VAPCIGFGDRERCVEQKDALRGPVRQIARLGARAEVFVYLSVDVSQRPWQRDIWRDREGEAVGVAYGRVGVLTQYDHAGVFRCGVRKGGEPQTVGRQDRSGFSFEVGLDRRPLGFEKRQMAPCVWDEVCWCH